MENWGSSGLWPGVTFLCVSVVGRQTAASFAGSYGLEHVTNAFIEAEEDMPRFGQLGCSGFIVLDGAGKIVSPRTEALLEKGEAAFRDLEVVIGTLMDLDDDELKEKQDAMAARSVLEPPPKPRIDGALLDAAPVRDIKALMRELGIDGAGCIERRDLIAAVRRSDACEVVDERPCGAGGACADGGPCEGPAPVPALPSVGVASMDEEHERCHHALEALAASRSAEDLRTVLRVFEEHFAHEEALMAEHGFGGAAAGGDGRFSAARSHAADHDRILNVVRKALDAAKGAPVPSAAVDDVSRALFDHATKFDALYEGVLPPTAA